MPHRRNHQVWDATSVADDASSRSVIVQGEVHVAVMLHNHAGTSATIEVEVAALDSASGGRNIAEDGWFPYLGAHEIVLAAGAKTCLDLSPFAPHAIRLTNRSGSTLSLSGWIAAS